MVIILVWLAFFFLLLKHVLFALPFQKEDPRFTDVNLSFQESLLCAAVWEVIPLCAPHHHHYTGKGPKWGISLVQKKRQALENGIGKQVSRKNWNLYLIVASVVIIHGFEGDVKALIQELSQSLHSCLLSVIFPPTFAVVTIKWKWLDGLSFVI